METNIVNLLEKLQEMIEKKPVETKYDTGRIRGTKNEFYAGSHGDAYMAGRNSAISIVSGWIKEAKKIKNGNP